MTSDKNLRTAVSNLNDDVMQRAWHVALRYTQDKDSVEHQEVPEVAVLVCSPDYQDRDDISDRHLVINLLHRHSDGQIQLVEQLWDADEVAAFCLRVLTMLKADDRLDGIPSWIGTMLTDDQDDDDDDEEDDDDDEEDDDDDEDEGDDEDDEDEGDDEDDEDDEDDDDKKEKEAPKAPMRRSSRRKPLSRPSDPEEVFDQGGDDDFDDAEDDDAEEEDEDD